MADIGLIPGDASFTSRAIQNTDRLTAALAENRNVPITIPRGTTYFYGTSETSAQVGCGKFVSEGAKGYSVQGHATLTGNLCRMVQLKPDSPLLRIRGSGFYCVDPIEMVGPGDFTEAAIEVEGRLNPATGLHTFGNIIFDKWGSCFRALVGYYDDEGEFVSDENHADNTMVTRCASFGCGKFFHSQNQQAVNWVFDNCYAQELEGPEDMIFADIERGGCVYLNNLVIAHNHFTIFQVRDFSPNTANLVVQEFEHDNMTALDAYLTLFKFNHAIESDMRAYKWRVRCSGFSPFDNTIIPNSAWLDIPDDAATFPVDRNDIQWDVRIFNDYVES